MICKIFVDMELCLIANKKIDSRVVAARNLAFACRHVPHTGASTVASKNTRLLLSYPQRIEPPEYPPLNNVERQLTSRSILFPVHTGCLYYGMGYL